ncbi:MAG: TonB-dependent receptor [Gemmatimonadales bacterium]|nr:TonB-dependent receptor [Gemmatimonadales bacterium]
MRNLLLRQILTHVGAVLLVLAFSCPSWAQGRARVAADAPLAPATVKGRIFDDESGDSMPYTNVFISGTNIGTMAFTDGFYIMRGLAPGTYTVKASYISYGIGSQTVTLGPGDVLNVDFHLEVQAIMAEPFVVAAERALVEVERTGSAHFLSSRQMEAMPLDQMVDMVAQQPGVTLQDNEIHIRGGRADDTAFIVDGMSVSDPLAGGGYGYQIDASIINEIEVLTGGFNAEYGQAVSGVVKVTTKEGKDHYEGRASFKRDYLHEVVKNDPRDWRDLTNYTESNNIDIVKLSLSGPDPIGSALRAIGLGLPGKQYFLVSGSADIRDGYLPIYSRQVRLQSPVYQDEFWAPRQKNSWNGMAKWTWNINPENKLNLNVTRQLGISQGFNLPGEGYPRPFMDNLDNYMVFTTENILTQLYYRQVLNDESWWELTLGRNFNRLHANINGNDNFLTYGQIDMSRDEYSQSYGSADRWHDHYSESYTVKGTYSFMKSNRHKFKGGFDLSFTEMQLIDLQTALGKPPAGKLGIKEDIFVAHPVVGAAFFQDTIEYRGLIVNVGLRGDVWAPGKEVEKVMENSDDYLFIYDDMVDEFYANTSPALGRRWKSRISPRLGLSFPFTERDKFFFNYGHFNQWPRFAYVYPQLEAQRATEVQLLGNPNLDPKVTVEYETGIQHEFGGLWSMGVTFFNRDIYDYAKSVSMGSVDIGAADTPDTTDTQLVTIEPVRYFNGDSARSLGAELSIIKRTTRWLSGSYSLEFQRSSGTNSDANEAYLQAIYGGAALDGQDVSIGGLKRNPLIWDKPWTTSLNVDFTVFDKERPRLPLAYPTLGTSFPFVGVGATKWTMPGNWSVNLLARAEAGQRYTQLTYVGLSDYDQGDRYGEVGPWKSTVNLRFNKFWRFSHGQKVTIYIEARNLLNHQNYRRVNTFTGDGYQLGDYNPAWEERWSVPDERIFVSTDSEAYAKGVINPSYIENPRIILWGASYQW